MARKDDLFDEIGNLTPEQVDALRGIVECWSKGKFDEVRAVLGRHDALPHPISETSLRDRGDRIEEAIRAVKKYGEAHSELSPTAVGSNKCPHCGSTFPSEEEDELRAELERKVGLLEVERWAEKIASIKSPRGQIQEEE